MSQEGRDEDDDLLRAIAAGDRDSFRRLMQRHVRPVTLLAQRITGNSQDADDVVQETFLRVWRLAGDWRPDGRARFSSWLYRVAYNLCIDKRRARPMLPLDEALDCPDTGPGGLEASMETQRRAVLAQAVGELPARQREALALCYYAEISGPEAAKGLGISLPALEALLVRARRTLKDKLLRRGLKNFGDLS